MLCGQSRHHLCNIVKRPQGPKALTLHRDQSGPGASAGGTLLLCIHLEDEWACNDLTYR